MGGQCLQFRAAGLDNRAPESVHGVNGMNKPDFTLADVTVERVLAMRIPALQRVHRLLFGKDSTVRHVLYLRRKLAWELQARATGGLPERCRQHALGIAWQTTLRTRAASGRLAQPLNPNLSLGHDTRLPPPGTLLKRQFRSKTVLVKVLAAGFEYEGRLFSSLSAIANQITGGNWNGFVFFGLNRAGRHGQ